MIALFEADDTEGFALGVGSLGENRLNLIGCGGSGDVHIRKGAVQQRIPDATARVDGLMAGFGQLADDRFGLGMADHFFSGVLRVRYASPPKRLQKSPSP
ncbi:MAG: hypothetical protein RL549_759 [Verrucomicrobiota bacterium]